MQVQYMLQGNQVCVPRLLKPSGLESVLPNKRSHHNEMLTHRKEEELSCSNQRKPAHSNKDPEQPKVNNKIIF